jgi:hypothetical protein
MHEKILLGLAYNDKDLFNKNEFFENKNLSKWFISLRDYLSNLIFLLILN